jgi:hypothetical protein
VLLIIIFFTIIAANFYIYPPGATGSLQVEAIRVRYSLFALPLIIIVSSSSVSFIIRAAQQKLPKLFSNFFAILLVICIVCFAIVENITFVHNGFKCDHTADFMKVIDDKIDNSSKLVVYEANPMFTYNQRVHYKSKLDNYEVLPIYYTNGEPHAQFINGRRVTTPMKMLAYKGQIFVLLTLNLVPGIKYYNDIIDILKVTGRGYVIMTDNTSLLLQIYPDMR